MPIYREYHYYFFGENYDIELMRDGCNKFIGLHDFKNFCKMKPEYIERGSKREIINCDI